MDKIYVRVIVLVAVVFLLSACAETSIPDPLISATGSVQGSSAATPTTQLPTRTAMPTAAVSPAPTTTLPAAAENDPDPTQGDSTLAEANQMNITIGDTVLTATLVENSSAAALIDALSQDPITINMRDYGEMEKVGSLGMELPRNDEQITTEAGDIILYQGNALVIYYTPNSWNFTRLGKINDVSADELKEILGDGSVTVTLSMQQK